MLNAKKTGLQMSIVIAVDRNKLLEKDLEEAIYGINNKNIQIESLKERSNANH